MSMFLAIVNVRWETGLLPLGDILEMLQTIGFLDTPCYKNSLSQVYFVFYDMDMSSEDIDHIWLIWSNQHDVFHMAEPDFLWDNWTMIFKG